MKNYIILSLILGLLFSSCNNRVTIEVSESQEIDSVFFKLANHTHWKFMDVFFFDINKFRDLGLKNDIEKFRFLWWDIHDNEKSKHDIDSIYQEYVKCIDRFYEVIPQEKRKYFNEWTLLRSQKPNDLQSIRENTYKATMLAYEELIEFHNSYYSFIPFDSVEFKLGDNNGSFKLTPVFHSSAQCFRLIVNQDTSWIPMNKLDSIYLEKDISDSMTVSLLGYDPFNLGYEYKSVVK